MKQIEETKSLEESVLQLQEVAKSSSISISEVFCLLPGKGRALILVLLSLPFCQPIQIPGLSIPFGLAIAFFGLRMIFGKRFWLPKFVLSKRISSSTLQKITDKVLLIVRKMKPWIHPRLSWVCQLWPMQMAHGIAIFILGILLALPLPIPLSNLTAAWSIFLIALGLLEDDGVLVYLGYVASFLTIGLFIATALSLSQAFVLIST